MINYSGTVFLVSHDRTFLDNVVTQSYVFTGKGEVVEIAGGYTDWLYYQNQRLTSNSTSRAPAAVTVPAKSQEKTRLKLSYKEKFELEQLPQQLEHLEHEQLTLQAKLADINIYKSEPDVAKACQIRLQQIDAELLSNLARWEELEHKNQ